MIEAGFAGQTLLLTACAAQAALAAGPEKYLRQAAYIAAFCLTAAFATLLYAFASSDFSLFLVYSHSHTLKPFLYKLTAAWGNHEGSLLLASLMLALYSLPCALKAAHGDVLMRGATRVLGCCGLLFGCYVAGTSNPFLIIEGAAPQQGRGFNPLLQDIGLAIHPPALYIGYVGAVLPFALALSGLRHGLLSREWAETARTAAAFSWGWLTAGILLGSHWAYRELGWGGFWFWDPVENASLMPWLALTALLHTLTIVRNRNCCYLLACALACLSFWLVIAGFFLVRSGVITSVHAFADAPERGIFIAAGLVISAVISVFALIYYPARPQGQPAGNAPVLLSRGGGVLLQNVWMVAALATVFLGTVYPLILEALTGARVTVGAPYYNAVFVWFAGALALLAALFPSLSAGNGATLKTARRSPAWITFFGAAIAVYIAAGVLMPEAPLPFLLLFPLVAAGFAAEITGLLGDIYAGGKMPASRIIMRAAHSGMWIALAGILLAGFLSREKEAVMRPGDTLEIAGFRFAFDEMERVTGPNFLALRTKFSVFDREIYLGGAAPEARFYPAEQQQTAEAAILNLPAAHLYISVGEALPTGEAGIRVMYRPGVPLIWAGGMLAAAGGACAAFRRGSRKRGDSGGNREKTA